MNKKGIVIYSLAALALVAIFLLTTREASQSNVVESTVQSTGTLSAPETSFDFGTIDMKDGMVTHRFRVQNNGSSEVRITKVYTTCMCTQARFVNAAEEVLGTFGMPGHGTTAQADIVVRAGEEIFVDAIFDPAAHGPSGVGLAQRSVYIESNAADVPTMELRFKAYVTN